ncbi:aminodeoxychorismate synthase component I [Alteromonas sp. ASW11-130]|uniref:aminodeoxychorismate synthase component I n=1 Tax=Alteromonas sp. ASW11-130 TaxID=3015775 RepID=UPI0022423A6A|nr:aminodeoxychorismate synthase component I [Alteromonas sp. ASW11-130]MCW8092272.1 aminodeoxychorismate synthase component I [Alteromonas sp. ASW11-130]
MSDKSPAKVIINALKRPSSVDLHALFDYVEDAPYSVLFDSAGSRESNARFNIAVWAPSLVVLAEKGNTFVIEPHSGERTFVNDKPLQVVSDLMKKRCKEYLIEDGDSKELSEILPFIIGAAGLCSYDLGRYYEQLPSNAKNELSCPDMAIGIYEHSLIEDSVTGEIFECRLSTLPPINVQQWLNGKNTKRSFTLRSRWQANLSKSEYTEALHSISDYLKAGDCYQVNMAQRFNAAYEGSEWDAYLKLKQQNKAPFSVFMRLPHNSILSISPERFISVDQDEVETKPIKGTRPRYADPVKDKDSSNALLNSEKDRAENLMIVDLLRNDLSKHCQPNSVNVPSLFALESYAAVHHLVSTVKGKLKPDSTAWDLIAGAFPGGSITGAPKIRAMEIIDELEPHRRHVYCGSILYMGLRGDMDSSILIRTLLTENNYIYCWAGGGIVLDSIADEEYQETLDKVSRILPVLGQRNE